MPGWKPDSFSGNSRRGISLKCRPMPTIGERCHELRVIDINATWRIVYRIDTDAIVILDVFSKKTRATPQSVINRSRKRMREYDDATKEEKET